MHQGLEENIETAIIKRLRYCSYEYSHEKIIDGRVYHYFEQRHNVNFAKFDLQEIYCKFGVKFSEEDIAFNVCNHWGKRC